MKIQLRHLVHVIALAEESNYTVAARRLNLSQPALSRSIQALEKALGSPLFDRLGSGVKPTYVGQIVVDRGRALLKDAEHVEREVQLALGLEVGLLSIGAGAYPSEISVGTACGRLAMSHPGIKLDVRVGDWSFLRQLVLDEKLDMAVAELQPLGAHAQLEQEALPRHQGYYICRTGHPLAGYKSITLEDTKPFPLVATSLPERFGSISPGIRVDTFRLVRDIVLTSNALGLGAANQTAADVAQGLIVRLPLQLPWLHTSYGFIWLKGRTLSPAALAFMNMVREVESEIEQMA